jgi:hypothetical protein
MALITAVTLMISRKHLAPKMIILLLLYLLNIFYILCIGPFMLLAVIDAILFIVLEIKDIINLKTKKAE